MIRDTIITLLATMGLLVAVVTLVVVLIDRQWVIGVEVADDLPPFDWDAAEKEFEDGPGSVDHT